MIENIRVIRWVGMGFFLLFALGCLGNGSGYFIVFLTSLLLAFAVSPLADSIYQKFKFGWDVKIIIVAALSFVWMASFLTTPDRPKQEEGQQEIVQELEEVEATPVPTPEPTPTPTPEPTPTPTPVPTPTPTPQPTPTPKPTPAPVSPAPAVETPPASQTNVAPPAATCPKNCTEARAMGMTNMTRDHECYRSSLDRDNDGIACDK